jgi:hypothetical protein
MLDNRQSWFNFVMVGSLQQKLAIYVQNMRFWQVLEKALERGDNIFEGHYALKATPLQQFQVVALKLYSTDISGLEMSQNEVGILMREAHIFYTTFVCKYFFVFFEKDSKRPEEYWIEIQTNYLVIGLFNLSLILQHVHDCIIIHNEIMSLVPIHVSLDKLFGVVYIFNVASFHWVTSIGQDRTECHETLSIPLCFFLTLFLSPCTPDCQHVVAN